MKKRILLCLLLVSFIPLHGQNAKSVFINLPDSLSPLLTKVNREDFADFLASKMKAEVKNKMEKQSELKELTEDYAFLQTTSQSTFQLKLLPLNDTTKVVCVIYTVYAPVADSRILFYTTNWKELPTSSFITPPAINDFLQLPDSSQVEEYNITCAPLDISLIKADLSKDNHELTFTFTSPEYLNAEQSKAVAPFIKKNIVHIWKEGRFVNK